MSAIEWLQAALLCAGAGFFIVGSLGLLRFPDVFTRMHALTKADNLGLGLVVFGLLPSAESLPAGLKLLLVWLLVLIASATAAYLVARTALSRGEVPWRREDDGGAR
jgi:multicomponent Na+:H+ antiporter subunit G